MMRYLLLLAVAVAAHGQYGAATSVVSGNGDPIAEQCTNANNVGRVWARKDGGAINSTFYVCSSTGGSLFGWELVGSGSTPSGGAVGGASSVASGQVLYGTAAGVAGTSAGLTYSTGAGGSIVTLAGVSFGQVLNSVGDLFITNNAAAGSLIFRVQSVEGFRLATTSRNLLIGTTTDGNFRLDIAASGSSGTLRAWDQTPTTGVTQLIVRAGAGQSTTNLQTWQNSAGSSRLLVTSTLGLVALGTFYAVQDSAGTINRAIVQSTMDVNSSYSFNFSSTTDASGTKDLSFSRAGVNIGQFGDGGANSNGLLYLKGVRPVGSTVANLPTASGNTGMIATVTDANATTIGTTVAGGGANTVLVWSNGTNWRIYAN